MPIISSYLSQVSLMSANFCIIMRNLEGIDVLIKRTLEYWSIIVHKSGPFPEAIFREEGHNLPVFQYRRKCCFLWYWVSLFLFKTILTRAADNCPIVDINTRGLYSSGL